MRDKEDARENMKWISLEEILQKKGLRKRTADISELSVDDIFLDSDIESGDIDKIVFDEANANNIIITCKDRNGKTYTISFGDTKTIAKDITFLKEGKEWTCRGCDGILRIYQPEYFKK